MMPMPMPSQHLITFTNMLNVVIARVNLTMLQMEPEGFNDIWKHECSSRLDVHAACSCRDTSVSLSKVRNGWEIKNGTREKEHEAQSHVAIANFYAPATTYELMVSRAEFIMRVTSRGLNKCSAMLQRAQQ
ncbi:unnamed protein product [Sphenostylis stenocarpa]|uniref:Uncharacterized protein n=1 Tax=Sphenostylis stenocarpa TaxID=92480 RepID=A0AA86S031_9FABA|nr:unnamed protein product [Sphenostylis stenocarpa]